MTVRQQWMLVLGIVAVLGGALFAATTLLKDELFPVVVGSPAPDFQAATLDAAKRTKTLADYRDQVVLLNVWATWCAPCRVEMPSMQRLHEQLGPKGLRIVAVSVDDPGSEKAIGDFAKDMGLTFEILHDASGKIQRAYQTTGVPETMVIGRDGLIHKKVIGAADWSSPANVALLEQLLAGRHEAGSDDHSGHGAPAPSAPADSGAAAGAGAR